MGEHRFNIHSRCVFTTQHVSLYMFIHLNLMLIATDSTQIDTSIIRGCGHHVDTSEALTTGTEIHNNPSRAG